MGGFFRAASPNSPYGDLWEYLDTKIDSPQHVLGWPIGRVKEFASEALIQSLPDGPAPLASRGPFSFVANGPLSGAPEPCAAFECRQAYLTGMARLAALYADAVYVENPFDRYVQSPSPGEVLAREHLVRGLYLLAEVQPLFDAGLFHFRQPMFPICTDCSRVLAAFQNGLAARLLDAGKLLERKYLTDTSASVGRREDDVFIEVKGPEYLVEHGGQAFYFTEHDSGLPDSVSRLLPVPAWPESRPITREEYRGTGVVRTGLIGPILKDIRAQAIYAFAFGATPLSSRSLDFEIARAINQKSEQDLSERLQHGLRHEVPLIDFLPMPELLQLRAAHGEDFAEYRNKVSSVLTKSTELSAREVEQAFEDEVRPQLEAVKRAVHEYRQSRFKNIRANLTVAAAAVAVGIWGGSDFTAEAFKMAGDHALEAGVNASGLRHLPQAAKENSYLFLWRVAQATRRYEP